MFLPYLRISSAKLFYILKIFLKDKILNLEEDKDKVVDKLKQELSHCFRFSRATTQQLDFTDFVDKRGH